jgi:hypothetical protein
MPRLTYIFSQKLLFVNLTITAFNILHLKLNWSVKKDAFRNKNK